MSLGFGAYKVGGSGQCFSMRRRYPWQPCERRPPNQNLLGAWKRRGQQKGVKWNLWLQQPQAPSCSSCIKKKKQTTHLPTECSWQWEQYQKTAVQAQGNSVLNSTAMSKELWITNGKDTRCQASWLEMPARASEGVRIWSWWALLVQHPRAWIWWSGIPLRAATMAAPMWKLWLEKIALNPCGGENLLQPISQDWARQRLTIRQ